jgi:hypothetical protein
MVDGVTWPTTLPPGWTVEWDVASTGDRRQLLSAAFYFVNFYSLLEKLRSM